MGKRKPSESEIDAAWDSVQGRIPKKVQQNNLAGMMASDAEEASTAMPSADKLKDLTSIIKKMQTLEDQIEKTSAILAEHTKAYQILQQQTVPDIFDEIGISNFTLADGTKVSVSRVYVASISEDRKPAAFEWLRENGHEAIIKHDLTVKLKKGEEEAYKDIKQDLGLFGVDFSDKEYVHPQTLKAFVGEQMNKEGSTLPQETFGVFPIRIAKVK
jgi:hypothetical protein